MMLREAAAEEGAETAEEIRHPAAETDAEAEAETAEAPLPLPASVRILFFLL